MKLRTKILGVLLLGAGLTFLLIPKSLRILPSAPETPQFLSAGKLTGMDAAGAREILGEPDEETPGGCGTEAYPTVGNLWFYLHETDTTIDELSICVYGGFVVGQKRTAMVAEEGEVFVDEQEHVAAALLQMLILIQGDTSDLSGSDESAVEI